MPGTLNAEVPDLGDIKIHIANDAEAKSSDASSNFSIRNEAEVSSTIIKVQNLCCSTEVALVNTELDPDDVPGVLKISVDVLGRLVTVRHDNRVSSDQLVALLNEADLGASIARKGDAQEIPTNDVFEGRLRGKVYLNIFTTLYLVIILILYSMKWKKGEKNTVHTALDWLSSIGVALGALYMIHTSNWRSCMKQGRVDMNLLMALSAVATLMVGEYSEGFLLVYAFMIAEVVQMYAITSVNSLITGLVVNDNPTVAYSPNHPEPLQVSDIKVGTLLCIRTGERVPLDGIVTKGTVSCDESSLTGESKAVQKTEGDALMSGTIVVTGYCEFTSVSESCDSTMHRVAEIMRIARGENNSQIQLFIHKFASYFTPAIVLIAIVYPVIGYFTDDNDRDIAYWIERGLVLVVIACPCALVLSSPVVIATCMAKAAQFGVIVKGGTYFETLSKVNYMVFDKTGTLTEGRFSVVDTALLSSKDRNDNNEEEEDSLSEDQIWQYCAAVERMSSHQLAHALVHQWTCTVTEHHMNTENKADAKVRKYKEYPGLGVYGVVNGNHIFVGNERVVPFAADHYALVQMDVQNKIDATEQGVDVKSLESAAESFTQADSVAARDGDPLQLLSKRQRQLLFKWKQRSRTCIFICINGEPRLLAGLEDQVRPSAKRTVTELKRHYHILSRLVTGDNAGTAHAVSRAVGLRDAFEADVKPNGKLHYVRRLQSADETSGGTHRVVAVVGDGVNDAPALAAADVGIALGKGGAALSVEAAGVILLSDDLLMIPRVIHLSQVCQRIITENIVIAFLFKCILLVISMFVTVELYIAVIVDVVSLLVVISNSLKPYCCTSEYITETNERALRKEMRTLERSNLVQE